MGNRIGWIVRVVAAGLLALASVSCTKPNETRTEASGPSADLTQCTQALEQANAALEACKRNTPPPGPIIDITKDPNSGGNYVAIGGTAANAVAPDGSNHNAKAFGALLKFEATFVLDGQTVTRNLRSAKVKVGNKTLEIIKEGDYPGVFTWKLDGTVLTPAAPNADNDWRNDLCCSVPQIDVEYMVPGGGTGTASAASIKLQAFNF